MSGRRMIRRRQRRRWGRDAVVVRHRCRRRVAAPVGCLGGWQTVAHGGWQLVVHWGWLPDVHGHWLAGAAVDGGDGHTCHRGCSGRRRCG